MRCERLLLRIRPFLSLAMAVAARVFLSKRAALVFLVEAVVFWDVLGPVASFAVELGYRVGPWLLVFMTADPICQLFFVTGLIFLLADAPFVAEGEASVVVRASRACWAAARIAAIALIVILYYLALLGMSWLFALPWMTFAVEGWGVTLTTLAETDAVETMGLPLAFAIGLVGSMEPLSALALVLGFEVLGGMALGLIILAVNSFTGSHFGVGVAAFVALFDLLTINTLPYAALRFSPVSHGRLTVFDFSGASPYFPTPLEALGVDVALVCLFGLLALSAMKVMEIQPRSLD